MIHRQLTTFSSGASVIIIPPSNRNLQLQLFSICLVQHTYVEHYCMHNSESWGYDEKRLSAHPSGACSLEEEPDTQANKQYSTLSRRKIVVRPGCRGSPDDRPSDEFAQEETRKAYLRNLLILLHITSTQHSAWHIKCNQ